MNGFCYRQSQGLKTSVAHPYQTFHPPGRDARPLQGYSKYFVTFPSIHLYTWVKRGKWSKVSCLKTQHNSWETRLKRESFNWKQENSYESTKTLRWNWNIIRESTFFHKFTASAYMSSLHWKHSENKSLNVCFQYLFSKASFCSKIFSTLWPSFETQWFDPL